MSSSSLLSSSLSSSRLDGDNQLETLSQNNLDVRDVETKIKKRDSLYDVFEEVYEDYEDDDDAVWTSVGNGRVKIWPLTFGMRGDILWISQYSEIPNVLFF